MAELNDELIRKMCGFRSTGLDDGSCASACGVSPHALCRWMEVGGKDIEDGKDSAYARLYAGMAAADSAFLAGCMSIIADKAKNGNWQAAAWLLERTHPGLYAESKRLEMGSAGGGVTVVNDAPTHVEVGPGDGKDGSDKRK